jgi:hypothetical protein
MITGGTLNDQKSSVSSKIRGAAIAAAKNYSSNTGWSVLHYPPQNMLIVNVPTNSTSAEQHVMNTETGAWCRFTGWDATCWAMFNDDMYFGTVNAGVNKVDFTISDDRGIAISADAQMAWNYLADRRRAKRATAIRFNFDTVGTNYTGSFGVGVDFRSISLSAFNVIGTTTASAWDTSPWDTTSWADEATPQSAWYSAHGDGYALSARIKLQSSFTGANWYSTTYLIEPGGVL